MRYAYIKNGDAVDQVRRLAPLDGPLDASGPDAFIGEFLRANREADILVLSRCERRDSFVFGSICAETFAVPRYASGRYIGAWVAALRVGAQLLSWRPQ